MQNSQKPIGIIDSGIGGLTVVKEIQKILPCEDIVYFGDSKNCPYGNRDAGVIAGLTQAMLDFLRNKEVKAVAVACNTISSVIDQCTASYSFPIVSIIEPTVQEICQKNLKEIGILATAFTIRMGHYDKLLQACHPDMRVVSQNSPLLAALVDSGNFEHSAINAEIQEQVGKILAKSPTIQDIVLACTHYPIMETNFQECYPNITFINPARMQANAVKNKLQQTNTQSVNKNTGSLTIYTTGDSVPYEKACSVLGISLVERIIKVEEYPFIF